MMPQAREDRDEQIRVAGPSLRASPPATGSRPATTRSMASDIVPKASGAVAEHDDRDGVRA